MPWHFYALLSALIFAVQDLLMRVLAVKSDIPRAFSVVFNLWGAFFAILAFIIQGGSFSQLSKLTPLNILFISSTIILYGLYERYQFSARKGINASSLSIIFRLSTVIAFIGSIVFLREVLTINKIIGATLIIGASGLLLYKNIHLTRNRSLGLAFLCSIFLGIAWILDKPASAHIQPALYSFFVWCIPIFIIAFPKIQLQQIRKEFYIGGWKVAFAALLNVVGFILNIQAFSLADASRVIPTVSINGILIVLGGIIILREHDHIVRKILAASIAFVGVYLLR